ncbi:glycoside hydrolase family 3 N-terminal domain-containing protein [Jeotgalibacillus sp. ET6]|uniref:glycoside hydrolase family 3 N-terminal domain-containing protein n=1 Tax=Jeotgalibacillus sp. ET6 TaxID=3037260 RepID=UPI002418715F|nr:glycoside hydrolase family 3 N-terminal domain-containing protein [Jeotgalibacillus sp. ET6]MDG5472676.1 glycoside hydrolase family 3 N-terminal domain-containing protein [Jeotgalibacillus sp. ET6]
MTTSTVNHLLKQMTIKEKIAQLLQLAGPFFKGSDQQGQITGPMAEMPIEEEHILNSSSVLGVSGAKEVISIQQKHLEENRLGIPLLFMADIVHGYKTIFPVPLAIGCSWDLELAKKSTEIAAKEAAVSGVHVTFAPMVDLVRDPRWGRVMESTGEDPHLNSLFAKAFVEGFQKENLTSDTESVAACVKHFAAYGAAQAGRDYNTVDLSERQLRESYLPAYKAALDAGCEMVMTAFNTVDGIPATGNKELMRDLLREEWGFDGVLISDWGAVKELIAHGVAEDEKEAAKKAILAGLDIEMMTACYAQYLEELVEQGEIDIKLIDEAVLRILTLKEKLDLFNNPCRGASIEAEKAIVGHADHRKASRDLAAKSTVLLKNNHQTLPLSRNQKIALIGPFGDSNDLLGPWAGVGVKDEAVTMIKALKDHLPENNLIFSEGSSIEKITQSQLDEALQAASQADVVVLALGESSSMSGEANSRTNIQLPQAQLELIKTVAKEGKPVVTVLFNGRPLDLHGVVEHSDALLEAWFPGTEGGNALVDLLYGKVSPSAKLSMSFPYNVGQVPVYYNHFNTGRPKGAPDAQEHYVSDYMDSPNDPLFPFGFGLSYTSFAYDQFELSTDELTADSVIEASIRVKNTGSCSGEEIVQLYIRDFSGEIVRPVKELKDFCRISLEPGESEIIRFSIKEEQLRYHHKDLSFTSDAGKFEVFAGPNSQDTHSLFFTLKMKGGHTS